jgi:hypothetical protein
MDISLILSKNYNGSIWALNGDDYSGLTWLSETPKPSEKELEAQWPDVEYETELDAVKSVRHAAYIAPGGSDAVFMKYQRGEATEQEWLDAVQAINDAHPYPVKEGK